MQSRVIERERQGLELASVHRPSKAQLFSSLNSHTHNTTATVEVGQWKRATTIIGRG